MTSGGSPGAESAAGAAGADAGSVAGSAGRSARRVEVYTLAAAADGIPALRPGIAGDGPRVPGVVLAHGEHPHDAARRALAGRKADVERLQLVTVLSDVRPVPLPDGSAAPGLHVLRLVFRAVVPGDRDAVPVEVPLPDPELLRDPAPAAGAERPRGAPPRVQRPAAYAVVVQDGEVLLTRVTGLGVWTLPGGGIDHGEHPDDAVRRETVEETGLELRSAHLVDVDSRHFTGRGPDQVVEDFHGVRILYRGQVVERRPPVVQEVGGSTDAAGWFPLEQVPRLRLADVVRTALQLER